jgi:hypothetical protein
MGEQHVDEDMLLGEEFDVASIPAIELGLSKMAEEGAGRRRDSILSVRAHPSSPRRKISSVHQMYHPRLRKTNTKRDGEKNKSIKDKMCNERDWSIMFNSSDDTDLRPTYVCGLCGQWAYTTSTEQCKPKRTKEDGNDPVIAVDSPHPKEKQSGGWWKRLLLWHSARYRNGR